MLSRVKNISPLLILISLVACGGGGSSSDSLNLNSDLYVYQKQSAVEDAALLECLDIRPNDFTSCELSKLALIGMDHEVPTVDDIMSRVLVTHDWMGKRFEQLLNLWPAEVRLLFRSTTGIVIARNIRPSFFQPISGAIYIDPSYLWLTVEEKQVIDQTPDFRSDYQKDLNFIAYGRFVNGPGLGGAYSFYRLDDGEERTLDDIRLSAARLIFHELAHASDFYPVSQHPFYSLAQTVEEAADPAVSDSLHALYPLENVIMSNLGQVMFRGVVASDQQQSLTPLDVGSAFDTEGAADDYAYAKFPVEGESPQDVPSFEDTAMLFEIAMMKYLFNKDRAFAVFDKPQTENPHYTEFVVRYGQYNRLGEEAVKLRAQLVAEQLLPEVDWETFFTNLESSTEMTLGLSWGDNIVSNMSTTFSVSTHIPKSNYKDTDFTEENH